MAAGGGGGSGGGRGGTDPKADNLAKIIGNIRPGYITATMGGNFSITESYRMYQEGALQEIEKWNRANGTNYTIDDIAYYHEGIVKFGDFVMDCFKELDTQAKYIDGKGILGGSGELGKTLQAILTSPASQLMQKDMTPTQKQDYERYLTLLFQNTAADVREGRIESAIARVRKGNEGIMFMQLFSKDRFTQDLQTNKGQNELLAWFEKYGDEMAITFPMGGTTIGTDNEGNQYIQSGTTVFAGGKERYERAAEAMKETFALRWGVDPKHVTVVFRNENIQGDPNEASAQFQFVVKNEGNLKNGTFRLKANSDKNKDPIIIRPNGTVVTAPTRDEAEKQRQGQQQQQTQATATLATLAKLQKYINSGLIGEAAPLLRNMYTNGQITQWDAAGIGWNINKNTKMTPQEMVELYNKNPTYQDMLYDRWERSGIIPPGIQRPRNLSGSGRTR